jgi:hypothetical protein
MVLKPEKKCQAGIVKLKKVAADIVVSIQDFICKGN